MRFDEIEDKRFEFLGIIFLIDLLLLFLIILTLWIGLRSIGNVLVVFMTALNISTYLVVNRIFS